MGVVALERIQDYHHRDFETEARKNAILWLKKNQVCYSIMLYSLEV
jgi:hypothetical protein